MHNQTTYAHTKKVRQTHPKAEQENTKTRTNSAPLIPTTSSFSSSSAHLHFLGHIQQIPQIAILLQSQHLQARWSGIVLFLGQTHFLVTPFLHTAHAVASQFLHQQILVGGSARACTLAQQCLQPSMAQNRHPSKTSFSRAHSRASW